MLDLIVIGAGPGGYVCAIRAAQLGMKVACIDKRGVAGGTCLNVGCIPSKALLHASEHYEGLGHLGDMGIGVQSTSLDLEAMMSFKQSGIDGNVKGISFLFKKNNIEEVRGEARITAPDSVEVSLLDGGTRTLQARNIVIATGSDVAPLPGVTIDEKRVVSSTGALELEEVPEHLLVVGGGYIGLELGSVWRRLGSKVTVVEFLDRITPGMDGELSKQFQRILKRQGIEFRLGTKVEGIEEHNDRLDVMVAPAAGGETETIAADVALISIGRVAYTAGLGLDAVGVALDERGRVRVNEGFATNVSGIYAIGDVIAGPMLAHKAEEEGVALAEMLAGQKPHVNYDIIPGVVYTAPEAASVGRNEEQLREAGVEYRAGKFPFAANGRAKVNNTTEGFVKVLAEAETDAILGVHILGADAGNMIGEAVVAMEFSASAEDVARSCHAHPTLSEAIKEAALAVEGRPIHS
ncbi:MAG: dihydrolipoyl dehydrogenase [Hyphomicrobiales bacterium]|nr:dihydrolipoyl dehydrogenase [Hyphomicrobiales bacterium]